MTNCTLQRVVRWDPKTMPYLRCRNSSQRPTIPDSTLGTETKWFKVLWNHGWSDQNLYNVCLPEAYPWLPRQSGSSLHQPMSLQLTSATRNSIPNAAGILDPPPWKHLNKNQLFTMAFCHTTNPTNTARRWLKVTSQLHCHQ